MSNQKIQKVEIDKKGVSLYYKITSLDDLPNEIWVDMFGFDGYYEVSNFGRVKSLPRQFVTGNGGICKTKEIIRKQTLIKDRLWCNISCNGKQHSINLSAIIYYSFYPEKHTDDRTMCVMHKDKIAYNNFLDNLILEKVSISHQVNFQKKLLPHLAENNRIKQEKNSLRTSIKCRKCEEDKPVEAFRKGTLVCKLCRSKQKKQALLNRKK